MCKAIAAIAYRDGALAYYFAFVLGDEPAFALGGQHAFDQLALPVGREVELARLAAQKARLGIDALNERYQSLGVGRDRLAHDQLAAVLECVLVGIWRHVRFLLLFIINIYGGVAMA